MTKNTNIMWINKQIQCPYCWENIEILIDPGEAEQDYIEDCSVCCRPIHFTVEQEHDGDFMVTAHHEDEL